jgi:hypothetical protein
MKTAGTGVSMVLLSRDELREEIAAAVGAIKPAAPANDAPTLLDRTQLAKALGCSLPTVDRLRRQGAPQFLLGDAPRFELDAVLAWLRTRSAGGGK